MKIVLAATILILSSLCRADSCSEEAKKDYQTMVSYYFGYYQQPIEPIISDLKLITLKKCLSPLDFQSVQMLFNSQTGQIGEKLKTAQDRYWSQRRTDLEALPKFAKGQSSLAQMTTAYNQDIANYGLLNTKPMAVGSIMNATEREKKCGKVTDIVKKLPPIRNQADSTWCQYFSLADLLSYKYKTDVSAAYFGHLLSPNGGAVDVAALNEAIHRFGLCSEQVMPSDGINKEYFNALEKLKGTAAKLKSGVRCEAELKNSELMGRLPGQAIDLAQLLQQGFDSAGNAIGVKFKSINLAPNISQTIALKQCAHDRQTWMDIAPKINIKQLEPTASQSEKMAAINLALDSGQPVSMGYNYDEIGRSVPSTLTHWSSIVGRRFANGQCQYQVRNSWGMYADCKNLVSEPDHCRPPGYFWANAEDIFVGARHIMWAE